MQIERSSLGRRPRRPFQVPIFLMLASLAHFQFANGVEARADKQPRPGAKPIAGWVCNAYGLNKTWRTLSGSVELTKTAALASALRVCQRSHFACRTSGCWPR
jgi:hypothetical protein